MRNVIYLAAVLLALSAVSCRKADGPKPEEIVARAAKVYYGYLLEGKYAAYTDGFYRPDSIPGSYREQLVTSAKQYVWQMKDDHGGLHGVETVGARVDTARHSGHAFLVLCFADSTREEIVVPMVQVHGVWYMR